MLRMLVMADIHVGTIKDITYFYNVITDIFDKELHENTCHAVIICGDYFDRLFKVNEEYTALAINIMTRLIRLCKKKNTKIRIIYGTESHEMSSYRLFNYHMNDPDIDFRVIETVEIEELFKGVNVLYIPEEYVVSKESYYEDFLYQGYLFDYIFGHGIIEDGMPRASLDHSPKSNEKQVPRFFAGELAGNCDKVVAFGHYHHHVCMENNVYYVGSLFRDSFGEEEPKGYGIIEDDEYTFVENEDAYIYDTITFEGDSDVFTDTECLVNNIKLIKEKYSDIFNGKKVGKIRLKFQPDSPISQTFKEAVRDLLYTDKDISYMIKEVSEVVEDVQDEVEEELEFVLDNSLNIEDKIHRYMASHWDSMTMSLEELNAYINEPLKI